MPEHDIKKTLIEKARQEGFTTAGVTTPEMPALNKQAFQEFLKGGWFGEMLWMQEKQERRLSPGHLWPEAQSVIMLAMNYGPEANPLPELERSSNGVISVYAKGKDYHDIVKKKLKNLARWFVSETGSEVKVFVDTAPVMEKPLAMQAGLGWQGKHTNLVTRTHGSWTFLGAIFTTHKLEPDPVEDDHCGNCRKCLDICPTDAFPTAYKLDARRCISYLTIEHKGEIPHELRHKMGNRIYGCDDCLAVCPWNKFAKTAAETRFLARVELDNPPLEYLLGLDDDSFRRMFAGSPVKRTGWHAFIRNCLIAAGNSNDSALLRHVAHHLRGKQAVLRGAAVWACSQLASETEFNNLRLQHIGDETSQSVLNEWQIGGNKNEHK